MLTGRNNPVLPHEIERMRKLRAQGFKVKEVASMVNRHYMVVSKYASGCKKPSGRWVARCQRQHQRVPEGHFDVDAFLRECYKYYFE